jgi:transaldolase
MSSALDQLREMTAIVADTGDIAQIKKYVPQDATTNPSLVAKAAKMDEYKGLVQGAVDYAKKSGKDKDKIVDEAVFRLSVEFGLKILEIIPGRVSTEVDARLSYDTKATVDVAHRIIESYKAAGISSDRILVKIASTWEGIRAAEILEAEGIHCNLTLLFGLHQAIACAEAKATLISPFVGRILDWHKKNDGKDFTPAEDPGVLSVRRIYEYFKHFGYKTEVMGASFRSAGEILELAGCDLLTIAPEYLGELSKMDQKVERKLDPAKAKAAKVERIEIDEAKFRAMHEQDRMANDKLKEGIEGFTKALEESKALVASIAG